MSVTRINRKMNLVVELEESDKPLFVHSTPISREVFDTHYLVMAKAFTAIHTEKLGAISGPRVAARLLKTIAQEMGVWPDVEKGLINEIARLTVVMTPGDRGWETIPYYDAKQRKIISEDDAAEVDNALVFFTLGSWMCRKTEKEALEGAFELWGARLESSNSTEFRSSLPTWKPPESSGEKGITSSRISSIG